MKDDLISIVIPTYNRNDSLEKAIISAENQTYKNIEIIVVDDNNPNTEFRKSNERRMSILCKKYHNIHYIKHEKNKNGAAARNTGIKHSSGKYIAFLDDDDEFMPDKIKKQLEYLKKNPGYKCVGCGCIKGNRKIENPFYGNISKEILTLRYNFTTSILLFEKAALLKIGMFDERFVRHQDYELLLKYCKSYRIGKMNEALLIKGKNNGENIPTGKKAEKNKKMFLNAFSDTINEINVKNKGFKKEVLYINYFGLFKDEIRGKHVFLSIKYGFLSFIRKPLAFISDAFKTIARRANQ